jgi:hypothetical protein
VKRLLIELEIALPDEAEEADALTLAHRVAELAVASTEAEAYSSFPLRPVGRLKKWRLIRGV